MLYTSTNYNSFPTKLFVNLSCDRARKRYGVGILKFQISIFKTNIGIFVNMGPYGKGHTWVYKIWLDSSFIFYQRTTNLRSLFDPYLNHISIFNSLDKSNITL